MKKLIILLALALSSALNTIAQYNPDLWEVIDSTINVESLIGLTQSNGIQVSSPYVYTPTWIGDELHVRFQHQEGVPNYNFFTMMFINWHGQTGKYFTKDTSGLSQLSDTAKGWSVDFTDPANQYISFQVKASKELTLRLDLMDIAGKMSNSMSPNVLIPSTDTWFEVVYSWGGDVNNTASSGGIVDEIADQYTGDWWNIGSTNDYSESKASYLRGGVMAKVPMDVSKIIGLLFTINSGLDIPTDETIQIRNIKVGNAANPSVYGENSSNIIYASKSSITFPSIASNEKVKISCSSTWTTKTNAEWIQVSPSIVSDGDSVMISVEENTNPEIRNSEVIFTDEFNTPFSIFITQVSNLPYLYTIDTSFIYSANSTAVKKINVLSNTFWNATSSDNWIQIQTTEGFGELSLNFSLMNNLSSTERTGTIVINAEGLDPYTIIIKQTPYVHINGYNPLLWEVIDATINVESLIGLTQSNGIEVNSPYVYTPNWIGDELHVRFQHEMGLPNYNFFTMMFINWHGQTGNYFTKDTSGLSQLSDTAKGWTVDFTDPANQYISFQVKASKELTLRLDLMDIAGKMSNSMSPNVLIPSTDTWIDVVYSWGGDVNNIASSGGVVQEIWDQYTGDWWNIGSTNDYSESKASYLRGGVMNRVPMDNSRIVGLLFTINSGLDIPTDETIQIRNIKVGNAANPSVCIMPVENKIISQTKYNLVVTSGSLENIFQNKNTDSVLELTLTGSIDIRDIIFIRDNFPNLERLVLDVAINEYTADLDSILYKQLKTYPANSIPNSAFKNLYSLKEISLPSSIAQIDDNAFSGCFALKKIIVNSTDPSLINISTTAFSDVNKTTCFIIVPKGSESAYAKYNIWKDFQIIESETIISYCKKKTIVLYPNPSDKYIRILGLDDVAEISFYSSLGTKLFSQIVYPNQVISIQNLLLGFYIVEINDGGIIYKKSFIKK